MLLLMSVLVAVSVFWPVPERVVLGFAFADVLVVLVFVPALALAAFVFFAFVDYDLYLCVLRIHLSLSALLLLYEDFVAPFPSPSLLYNWYPQILRLLEVAHLIAQ